MTGLLDRLAAETPRRQQTIRNDALGKLITRHMGEIDAAREQGYSWRQIELAAKAMWTESGEWGVLWSPTAIEERYRRLKKESTV